MRFAYVNGSYVPHHEAAVHIEDRGYQFADGIYEYIAFYNKKLLDGGLHLNRLERSLRELKIAQPMSRGAMQVVIRNLIERNGKSDGGLYMQITRGVARRDHAFPKNVKPAVVMTVCSPRLARPEDIKNGVHVITQADIRWQRRDVKSISLLPNILAKQEAVEHKAREVWLVENGNISEGSASNSYIVTKSGEVVTHPTDQHILGGITRDVLLKLARKAHIQVNERPFTLADIRQASEAFLTSTSANVLPVVQVDDIKIGSGKPGPVAQRLNELYTAHIFEQTGKQF